MGGTYPFSSPTIKSSRGTFFFPYHISEPKKAACLEVRRIVEFEKDICPSHCYHSSNMTKRTLAMRPIIPVTHKVALNTATLDNISGQFLDLSIESFLVSHSLKTGTSRILHVLRGSEPQKPLKPRTKHAALFNKRVGKGCDCSKNKIN